MDRKPEVSSPLIGVGIRTNSPWVCEALAAVGYDLLWIDAEHSSLSPESIDGLILLSRALGLKTYVRVTVPGRTQIQQVLDAGADAVVLPQVRNLAHAKEWAACAKYPPLGIRGMGTPRNLSFGDAPTGYVESENSRTKCFVMVETPGALCDVEAIAALPTVDGLFMGPYDLSLTRGRGQYMASKADWLDADTISNAARSACKLLGMQAFSQEGLQRAVDYGAAVVTAGDEFSIVADALRTRLERLRSEITKLKKAVI